MDQDQLCGQDTCQGDSGGPLWTEVNGRAVLIGSLVRFDISDTFFLQIFLLVRLNVARKRSKDNKIIFKLFAQNSRPGKQGPGLRKGSLPWNLHEGISFFFEIYIRVLLSSLEPITQILIVKIR